MPQAPHFTVHRLPLTISDPPPNYDRPVPLFPLAQVALLPSVAAPIHVFEPRYRSLTADALDGAGLIAMACYSDATDPDALEAIGTPPVRPVACLARVARHQRLPDGRYLLLLQGLARCRVLTELDHDPYRLAHLAPLESATMEIELRERRQAIEALLAHDTLRTLPAVQQLNDWLTPDVPTAALADLAAGALAHDTPTRYRLLAEPDPHTRADWLLHHLQHTLRVLQQADRLEPPVSDDGYHLN